NPAITKELAEWHGELCCLVHKVFGKNSNEFHELSSVNLEPPPELQSRAEQTINQFFPDQDSKQDISKLVSSESTRQFLAKRLLELDELIEAYLYSLRRSSI
ncbi:MAG: hypothetical protein V3R73_07420, partial [Sphingomonadales bacterium]